MVGFPRDLTVTQKLRNIAIIAHVDHGKTTLVDQLLRQSGTLDARKDLQERVMDSNDLERERGITILAKNTAITWGDFRINIVDTPGHADFGGEVERVLAMVDCVLLLVDAVDGPMPQTRFVTQKRSSMGCVRSWSSTRWTAMRLARPGCWTRLSTCSIAWARPTSSWISRWCTHRHCAASPASTPRCARAICSLYSRPSSSTARRPTWIRTAPLQLQVTLLDYSSYVGAIGVGRIKRGTIKKGMAVTVINREGKTRPERITQVLGFHGLTRIEVESAFAGDIVAFAGISEPKVSDTLCDPLHVEALPSLTVDEPTISMTFEVNTSPFLGRDGKFVTSRQIRERLDRESIHNVALRVEPTADPDKFVVFGRGELHLGVLLENMRREGYEMAVSRPRVVIKQIDGVAHEPIEQVTVDADVDAQGAIMQALGSRGGDLKDMQSDRGRVRLDYLIPSRGLIGFQTEFRTMTRGTGLLHHVFDHYGPVVQRELGQRPNGVLISNGQGVALAYSLFSLQERGRLCIGANEEVYEGMIIGMNNRDDDLVVNPLKGKKLTNMRASGKDEAVVLSPPIRFSLEQAMEFIDDDELIEVTPNNIRLRKRYLLEGQRKRSSQAMNQAS